MERQRDHHHSRTALSRCGLSYSRQFYRNQISLVLAAFADAWSAARFQLDLLDLHSLLWCRSLAMTPSLLFLAFVLTGSHRTASPSPQLRCSASSPLEELVQQVLALARLQSSKAAARQHRTSPASSPSPRAMSCAVTAPHSTHQLYHFAAPTVPLILQFLDLCH